MKFSALLIPALVTSTFASNCKTSAGKTSMKPGTELDLIPYQSGTADSKAAGVQISIVGKIVIVDDCTFTLKNIDLSGTKAPESAKLTWWGGPDQNPKSEGFPIIDQGGNFFTGDNQTWSLSPLVQTLTDKTAVGASFNDFKQMRLFSLTYNFMVAYADLPGGSSGSGSTGGSNGGSTGGSGSTGTTTSTGASKSSAGKNVCGFMMLVGFVVALL